MTIDTAIRDDQPTGLDSGQLGLTARGVLRSEWIKFRSLRSMWAIVFVATGALIVLSLVIAYNTRNLQGLAPEDATASSTLQGYYLGQLLMGALGILFVTGEYGTGLIRATFVAVPKRLPVLAAKIVVLLTVALPMMVGACVVAFLSSQALLSRYRPGYSFGDPGVTRAVIGTGVYLALITVFGASLGWITRSTAGALVTYAIIVWIAPLLLTNVLGTWGKDVGKYLPSVSASSFVMTIRMPDTLSPWTGLLVLLLWIVGVVVIAAAQLRRRDA